MATTELEEMNEDTSDLADGFSKYADELESLTGFSILEEGTTDTYKDIYDIFDGISAVWDDLSDTSQARVAEILGGTRQLQVISSIMNNWTDATDAYEDAMTSVGVATEANETYMESITAKVNQLQVALQELASDTINTDLIKSITDFATSAVEAIDYLIEHLGTMGTLLTGTAIVAGIKSIV